MRRAPAVWITGARTGLGRALARTLLQDAWHVVTSSRTRASLTTGEDHHWDVPMNVRRSDSVQRAWKKIRSLPVDVEILVNNAGVTTFADFDSTSPAVFKAIMETNLMGTYLATSAVLPSMKRRKKGLIVNILSYAAKAVYTKSSAYAASKAGADMMMRILREEMRPHGIRIVNVFPGAIDTPMWSVKMRRKRGKDMMPVEEVAHAVASLIRMPPSVVPEELVLRPNVGDLTV